MTRHIITITLDKYQCKKAEYEGLLRRARSDEKRKDGGQASYPDLLNKYAKDPEKVREVNGAACEIALAALARVLAIFGKNKSDHDCVIHGLRADAKQATSCYGLAALCNKVDKNIDIFVLGIGRLPTFHFCGWAHFDELVREENITDKLQSGLNYVLPIQRLRQMDELLPGHPYFVGWPCD